MIRSMITALVVLMLAAAATAQVPSAINYQGELTDSTGVPVADSTYLMTFSIYDAPAGGTLIWTESQPVTTDGGLFDVILGALDSLGDSVFQASPRYLGLAVDANPELAPRTLLVAVPWSFRSGRADTAAYAATAGASQSDPWQQTGGDVHLKSPADNVGIGTAAPTTKLDISGGIRATGTANFGPGNNVAGLGSFVAGNTNVVSGEAASVLGGQNNGATADGATVGGGFSDTARGIASVVAGGANNVATSLGATVSGGGQNFANGDFTTIGGGGGPGLADGNVAFGTQSTVGGGNNNAAIDSLATIGGGGSNMANGVGATIGGGQSNQADSTASTVGGGQQNSATFHYATIAGGLSNQATGSRATIGGGGSNIATGTAATIGGGLSNQADSTAATVAGGKQNWAKYHYTTVSGGLANQATDSIATVGGGASNVASGLGAVVGGGDGNLAGGDISVVAGGALNSALGDGSVVGGGGVRFGFGANIASGGHAVIAGGRGNKADSNFSVISGGSDNRAGEIYAVVGGGLANSADSGYSAVVAGSNNNASGVSAIVGGGTLNSVYAGITGIFSGANNTVTGEGSSVLGGFGHRVSGQYSAVGGGKENHVAGDYAVISGGGGFTIFDSSSASGDYSMIPGGRNNTASGNYSLAAGRRARALHDGAFVWADSTDADFTSNAANTFAVRAYGGVTLASLNPSYGTLVSNLGGGDGLRVSADVSKGNLWGAIWASNNGSSPALSVTSSTGNAAYLAGSVSIQGTLSKSAGSFKIDHPVDPENKYLYHSFVESPDMKNVYDGIVILDNLGEAEVTLPDYFDALNADYRYQLTCVGGHAPVYIAREVTGNRFAIAGGTPGLKVSWQVTGVRQDAYARAHRIPVEENKPQAERGTYLHPVEHGQPAAMGLNAAAMAKAGDSR